MKSLASEDDEDCPFAFNFDASIFRVGDTVSYRVPDRFGDMPFVGVLLEVGADHVVISSNDPEDPDHTMRGTREDRPRVCSSEALR